MRLRALGCKCTQGTIPNGNIREAGKSCFSSVEQLWTRLDLFFYVIIIQVMHPGANKHQSAVNFRQIQEAQLCWLLLQLAHKCHCYWVDHLNTAAKSQE